MTAKTRNVKLKKRNQIVLIGRGTIYRARLIRFKMAVFILVCLFAGIIIDSTCVAVVLPLPPSTDFMLILTDLEGNVVFYHVYEHQGHDVCFAAIRTRNGGFALAGSGKEDGKAGTSGLLVVTDSSGTELWCRYYRPDSTAYSNRCISLLQLSDGCFIIAGDSGYRKKGVWLFCISEAGEPIWSQYYEMNATGSVHCQDVIRSEDGGYILAGLISYRDYNTSEASDSRKSHGDGWILKTNCVGQQQWLNTLVSERWNQFNGLAATHSGGYIAVGENGTIVKTNSKGDFISETMITHGRRTGFSSIRKAFDSGYVLGGESYSDVKSFDFYLVKLDVNGDSVWSRTYGGDKEEHCSAVEVASDGGYLLSGSTLNDSTHQYEGYLLKTDTAGQQEWAWSYGCQKKIWVKALLIVPRGYVLAGCVEESSFEPVLVVTPR